MIDGYPVRVNDSVFVIGSGIGTVTKVSTDGFYVKTGRGEVHYRTGGYVGNQRRVYWHDPIFILPPKNRGLWKATINLSIQFYQELAKLCEFEEDVDDDVA